MIELVVIALALAAVGGVTAGVVRHRRRRRLAAAEQVRALPAARRVEAGELKPGDVVDYLGTHYLVEGVASLDEGAGTTLVVARLAAEEGTSFLVVEPGSALPPVLAAERDPVGAGRAMPNVVHDGRLELRIARRAAARASVTGEMDRPADGPCELGRYEGPGGRVGHVLAWSGDELVLVGRPVTAEGLTLLQGGDVVGEG